MAFTDEAQVYEALGLEAPQEEPAQETAPEQEETPVQEETAQEETPTDTDEPEGEVEDPDGEEGGQEDPLEKLRRELTEQHQAELEQLRQQHQNENDQRVAGMNLKNPYDGNKPITTQAEYDAYLAAHQQAQWDRIAQQTGMSREQLDALIAEHPEVRKGLEAQAAADAARQQQEQAQLQQRLAADIAAIGAECPAVKDQESLVNHPSWPKVAAKMKAIPGLGVADAFFLVNRSELAAGRAAGEGQRVRNNLAGKGHMVPSGSRGGGVPNMTREQEAMYRALVPGATRDEILKFHQDNMKGEQK